MTHTEPLFPIVVAEDDDGHAMLIQRNLMRSGLPNPLIRVTDGQQAIDLLTARRTVDASESDSDVVEFLLLLDLRMPRVGGMEVLHTLKSNPETARFPVIVLSTTDDPREIRRCYDLGCNIFVQKPIAYDSFADTIQLIGRLIQSITLPVG